MGEEQASCNATSCDLSACSAACGNTREGGGGDGGADLLAATHILQLLREIVRGETDINHLLVVAAVQVPHLAHQLGVNEAIGRDQVVRQGRFAVVHVRQDAYVPNP